MAVGSVGGITQATAPLTPGTSLGAPAAGKAAAAGGSAPVLKGVAYRCPTCNDFVSSMEEALRHCPRANSKDPVGPQLSAAETNERAPGASKDGSRPKARPVANGDQPGPKAEPVAYDDHGRPTIVRWVDPETGAARTVVQNEDGTQRSFGESTMASLLSAEKEEAAKWTSAFTKDLTSHQLRGLVHELGQRLVQSSQLYTSRLEELQKLSHQFDKEYFGLADDATEKDLDNAYRRLAKKMHPDKNGGTEEAKVRFQKMKEKYEGLKTKMGEPREVASASGPLEEGEAQNPQKTKGEERREGSKDKHKDGSRGGLAAEEEGSQGEEEGTSREGKEAGKEAATDQEENSDGDRAKKPTSAGYDPKDKDSMVKTISRYAEQLRDMTSKMKVLVKELTKAKAACAEMRE